MTSAIYVCFWDAELLKLKNLVLIFTTKHENKIAVNPVELTVKADIVLMYVSYDLQGIEVKAVSLSWAPWLILSDCDEQVKKISGTYYRTLAAWMILTLCSRVKTASHA